MSEKSIDCLSENTKILSIGSLFRQEKKSKWGINLWFSPHQEKSSLTLSNAPVLARKRILNPTIDPPKAGYSLSFSIESTEKWQRKTLADYPIKGTVRLEERDEWCFYFLTDTGVQIFLPQFELARALFFHNAYLSRTALDSDCLNAEVDIQRSDLELVRINILKSSSFPVSLLADYGARRLLSWLLVDQNAKASFESIRRLQKVNGYNKNGYRHWHFQFDPPKLCGVRFEVRGRIDKELNCMFVYEVIGISNITADVPPVVEIYHPDFKEYIRGQGAGGVASFSDESSFHTVHEELDANTDCQPVVLSAPSVVFKFANAFMACKVTYKKQNAASGKLDQEIDGAASNHVSVDEGTLTGDVCSADWDTIEDQTDDVHLFANKFKSFENMIDELVSQYGWVVESTQIRKLPGLPRCKMNKLINGDPRCMAVFKISSRGKSFHILEVDTSDAKKLLSTQILRFKSQYKLENQLRNLEIKLLKGSLRWPSEFLVESCGVVGSIGVHHPKTNSTDNGSLNSDSISNWAARFHAKLEAIP